jgi:hypothetical protein
MNDPEYARRNVVHFSSWSYFASTNEPDQWICWDFHDLRVRPAHYAINGWYLKSWVVETSLDGETWTDMDRKTDNKDFTKEHEIASFAVSNSAECRLGLSSNDESKRPNNYLLIFIQSGRNFSAIPVSN